MRFFGGFLKFISILLMLAGTVVCTAVSLEAEVIEAYLVMGGVWILVILFAMSIWFLGTALGQLSKLNKRVEQLEQKVQNIGAMTLRTVYAPPAPVQNSARLADLLRRPQVTYADIAPFDANRPELPLAVTEEVEIQLKYAGYLARQLKQVEEFKKEEARLLPADIDYSVIAGLRLEAREKLQQISPMSIGQAGRISGVSPADIAVLLIWLEQR